MTIVIEGPGIRKVVTEDDAAFWWAIYKGSLPTKYASGTLTMRGGVKNKRFKWGRNKKAEH